MNKNLTQLFVLISLLFTLHANAQVGIGTNQPDPSAQLEILSNSKGLLIPRMSDVQRGSISRPANGLLIYQTNNNSGFYFYNNGAWQKLASDLDITGGVEGSNSLLSGLSLPLGTLGKDGDFYINTVDYTLFGPKREGTWPMNGIKLATGDKAVELSLSLDANQNLSIKEGNSVSLADFYQSLNMNGTVLSISGPKSSQVDLSGLVQGKLENIAGGSVLGNANSSAAMPVALSFEDLKARLKLDQVDNSPDAEKKVLSAQSAAQLATPRSINGVAFDGTKDIVIPVDGVTSIEGKAITSMDGTITISNGSKAVLDAMSISLADQAVSASKIANGAVGNDHLDKVNIPLSGFGPANEPVSMGGFRITNLPAPTQNRDAANKKYVDDKLADIGNLSLDNNQNLSVNGGNSVSLADLYQNLSLAGTILSISGPRQSHVDLAGLLGNGTGTGGVVSKDLTLKGNGTTGDPLGIAAQGIAADRLKNITTNGAGGQVLASDGNGGFTWTTVSGSGAGDATTTTKGIIKLAGDLSGTADAPILADNAVTTNKIANGNVTNEKIAGPIDADKIDGVSQDVKDYVAGELANGGTGGSGTIPEAEQTVLGAIQLAGDLTGTAKAPLVRDGAITTDKIADDAITTEKLQNGSITNDKIVSLDGSKITGTITGDKITGPIAASEIDGVSQDVKDYVAGELANGGTGGTVTIPEAEETVLGAIQLAGDLDGTAKAPVIRDNAITTDKIANGNITNDKILSLDGSKITGTIAGDKIASIDAGKVTGLTDLLDDKEELSNKTQNITTATPSADKYPSEDAVVKYVTDVAATIVAGGAVEATTTTLGTIVLAGDLSGTAKVPVISTGAITDAKLATNAVTTVKIVDLNVTESKLADDAVTENKIKNGSVTDDKITGPITASKINGINKQTQDAIDNVEGAITALSTSLNGKLGDKEDTSNKSNDATLGVADPASKFPTVQAVKTYVDTKVGTGGALATGTTAGTIIMAGDLAGSLANTPTIMAGAINAGKLATDAVITDKILDKNITTAKLADGAVTTLQLGTGAVTNDKIAAGIDGGKVADGTITDKQIAPGTITSDKIASLDPDKVTGLDGLLAAKQDVANLKTDITLSGTNTEYPSVLAVKTYVDTKVGNGGAPATATTLGTIQLAGDLAGSAAAPVIKADAITATKLAANAVTTDKITDKNVTSAKLADGAVTNDKIANGIDGGKIADGSVTSDKISGSIDADKIDGVSQDVLAALALKEDAVNKYTDGTLVSNSDQQFPTVKATKTYVDKKVNDAVIGAGSVPDASATVLGKIQLTGDLGGFADNPTVPGLLTKEDKITILPVEKGGTGIASYTPGYFIKAKEATLLTEVSAAEVKVDLGLDKVENLSGADIDNKITAAVSGKFIEVGQKGTNGGVATLGPTGKIPSAQLPDFESGRVDVVADHAEMFALSTENLTLGSLAIVTGESKTYVLASGDGSALANWVEIVAPGAVRTVNGKTGDVVLTKADFTGADGIDQVDNTSDLNKPISSATQAALDLKQDIANISQDISNDLASANPDKKYPSLPAVKAYVDSKVVSGGPDASETQKGVVQLTNDLGGTATSPMVKKVGDKTAAEIKTTVEEIAAATSADIANTLVKRDASGNFAAGTIQAELDGNAKTATSISGTVEVQHGGTGINSVPTGSFLVGKDGSALATKTLAQVKTDLGLTDYEVHANKSQSLTTDATSTAKYPSVKAVKDYVDGKVTTGSADKLTTPRKINGVEFDGTKDITIPFKLTNIPAGNYTNANITVDADGVITLIENGTGGAALTPATKTDLGAVIVGDGIDVDGTTGKISTKTDLAYDGDTMQGQISSTTGLSATIPGASASKAGLMTSADKTKLDKIPEPKVADANKVLTVNSTGTAVEWKEAVPASGGGGSMIGYKVGKHYVRATGPGVTAALTNGFTWTVTIPVGVTLDYIKVFSSYLEMGKQGNMILIIKDENKIWNNSIDDMVVPLVNILPRSPVPTMMKSLIHSPATTQFSLSVDGVGEGAITLHSFSIDNFKGDNGFDITIRP